MGELSTNSSLASIYVHTQNVDAALAMSTYGIYLHAVFLSLTLGIPLAITAWLIQWRRTGDGDYLRYAKTLSVVLAINFSLGVVTGTLVEFGLLDIWPTSMVLFAAPGFLPLAFEATIAFIGEAALLTLYLATLGKWSAYRSAAVLMANWALGSLSGYFILTVNAWMNVPWGAGTVPQALYPFLPSYGPQALNETGALNLMAVLMHYAASSPSGSLAVTNVGFTSMVGRLFDDAWLPLMNPDALVTTLHTLLAAYAVGLGTVAAILAFKHARSRDPKYMKLLKPILWILVVVLLVQPTLGGHLMGDAVVKYQPTKFTAMVALTGGSGVYGTEFLDPIEALFAYGDPYHPIHGFQYYIDQCSELGNTTFGELYSTMDPRMLGYVAPIANTTLADNCVDAVKSIESLAPLVSGFYYSMIVAGIVAGLASLLALFTFLWRAPAISRLSDAINYGVIGRVVGRDRVLPLLVLAMAIAADVASTAGWAAREVGRQPWTVYGMITTNEVVTPVTISPAFEAIVFLVFTAVAIGGGVAMIYAAKRPELLDRLRRAVGGGQ
ncbi:cytochrome oxidase subunit I [Thermocladium modestius]|uniref:Cytochrome oxidase subunit I n=1 Tax=Thermocladium modestius TaxID=62609 RepID=A0A830GUR3_9CREN|nr:cytochrome ubiquinol oxidase subunit I [Thermocladium modestius]GGP19623.1 cytochrome oxidase subunit I [Thermocladium modestius]